MQPDPLATILGLERRLVSGVIAVTLTLLMLTTGVISHAALNAFDREVRPELGREAAVIGGAIVTQLERALAIGVPADELVGVEPFFEGFLTDRPTLDYISLTGPANRPLHIVRRAASANDAAQDVALPVRGPAGPVGTLHIGVNSSRLERSATDSMWDISIVLLVSLLATVEVLLFLTDRSIGAPLRLVERVTARVAGGDWSARAQTGGTDEVGRFLLRLNGVLRRINERRQHVAWLADEVGRQAPGLRARAADLVQPLLLHAGGLGTGAPRVEATPRSPALARAPLFLYVFAEQLSTSFIPLFAQSLRAGETWVSAQLAAGLPITAFAGLIAVATPFGARLVGRYGGRAVLAAGCLPAAFGYAMAAQSASVEAFILWRGVTAVGYALITMACQSYLIAATGENQRGSNMAVFVTAAMTGAVCGTAIGSVLADRLGFRVTFLVSAALTLAAGLLARHTMDGLAGRRPRPLRAGRRGALRAALGNPGFRALVLFAAMPAKLVLTGFVFYISPLFLSGLGDTQPEIGRQIMLYGLAMLVTIRLGAWTADRFGAASVSIAIAGAATGLGLLGVLVVPPPVAVPLAIVVVGLSQGAASAPMLAVVPELCPELAEQVGSATLYGYLRFAERIGSIVGPLLAAVLTAELGFTAAIAAIGGASLLATGIYVLAGWRLRRTGSPA